MKKVAILTFYYKLYNYGGMLQAYALWYTIKRMGYEVDQISFQRSHKGLVLRKIRRLLSVNTREKVIFFRILTNKLLRKILHKSYSEQDIKSRILFDKFAEGISHTNVVTRETISSLSDIYDLFIVGSDQVWNPEFVPMTYFFDFLPQEKRRASYAASIRIPKFEKKEGKKIKKLLENFSVISVRENTCVKTLRDIGVQKSIDVVLDPTLLMKQEDWNEVMVLPHIDQPYILLYLIKDKSLRDRIIKFAKDEGLKIVDVGIPDGRNVQKYDDPIIDVNGIGPAEFLGLVKKAEYVIPDSFHGTALSIIFKKKFVVISGDNTDDRKKTILSRFNLEERLSKPTEDFIRVLKTLPDYSVVEEKLNIQRKDSFDVLRKILSDGED